MLNDLPSILWQVLNLVVKSASWLKSSIHPISTLTSRFPVLLPKVPSHLLILRYCPLDTVFLDKAKCGCKAVILSACSHYCYHYYPKFLQRGSVNCFPKLLHHTGVWGKHHRVQAKRIRNSLQDRMVSGMQVQSDHKSLYSTTLPKFKWYCAQQNKI